MTLHFYLQFSTRFGQTLFVSGNIDTLGNDDIEKAVPLEYLNDKLWHGSITVPDNEGAVRYKYLLRQQDGDEVVEFGDDRQIVFSNVSVPDIVTIHTWNYPGRIENAFYTQPFQNVLLKNASEKTTAKKKAKTFTHEFKVKAPLLKADEVLCITGSGAALNEWQTEKPILLSKENIWWSIKLNLSKETFPVTYKYGIYNTRLKQFIKFESGDNRMVLGDAAKKR